MVTAKRGFSLAFILPALSILFILISICPVHAAVTYSVEQEWVQVWINNDGSIDIRYNITLTYRSGSPQGIVTVGMPRGGFRIDYVQDVSGNNLDYDDVSSGDYYGIDVTLESPIVLNRPNTFIIYAVVPGMVSTDATNPGNVGMQFFPTTFPDAIGPIESLRVVIILPEGVTSGEVKYPTGMPFDNVFTEGSNLVVYWERKSWPAYQEFRAGVSLPEKYVNLGPNILQFVAIGAAIVAAVGVILIIYVRFGKASYIKPRISIEALGAARGLTSVEAPVVLDLKPVRVLTMVLFGLLLKRVVAVTAVDPLIKLQRLERSADEPSPRLWYYEIDYLGALRPEGGLEETSLAQTYLELRDTVDQKLRGYSRADTANYYRSVVNKAWEQVTQAGTPELKGEAVDQNIEWLLADEGFDEKFRVALPPEIIILPRPDWWWYWHGPHFPPGKAPVPPTAPTQTKPIPGQDFANNIVRGLEKAANGMVKNVQDFTNRLVPAPVAARQRPVRGQSSCICACAQCACACACVSCACACAHGGGR